MTYAQLQPWLEQELQDIRASGLYKERVGHRHAAGTGSPNARRSHD